MSTLRDALYRRLLDLADARPTRAAVRRIGRLLARLRRHRATRR